MSAEMASPDPTRAIVVDYHFPEPSHKVWRALTEPALLAAWLMSNDIRPVVGHRFTFRAQPVPGWDGVVHCEVLAVEPQRLLRYRWRGGSDEVQGYGRRLDTVVTWTLAPAGDGETDLHLLHDGFTADDSFALQTMGNGWRGGMAARLGRVLAGID